MLEDLYKVRARYIEPEALDKMAIPELDFAVSPNDLLYNVIEIKRAKRAMEVGMIGQPKYRDMRRTDFVSELEPTLIMGSLFPMLST